MWIKVHICFMTISDSEQPCKCCFGWTQWQPFKCFFIERMFVFFITLLLKKMGILNRFWKFYPFIEKKVLGKQLSQGLYSKYIFRLLHGPKFQICFAELNMMVKVVKLFSGVLKAAPMNFIGKRLYRNLIFSNVSTYKLKKDFCTGVFLWALPNISESSFCKTPLGDCFC